MTLRETLEKIKNETKKENFNAVIESMKRKANKGMIPNVSAKDIDNCLREMEEDQIVPKSILEKEEMISIISDLENACNKYGYLAEEFENEDSLSEEDFNIVALDEFYKQSDKILSETLSDKYYEIKDKRDAWKEENPTEHGRYMGLAGAGAGVAATAPFLIDTSKRHALRQAFIDNSMRNGSTASRAKLAAEFNKANPSLLKKAGAAILSGGQKVGSFLASKPLLGAGLVGAGAVAAGSLLALAIRKARRKRAAQLKEGIEKTIIFSEETLLETKKILDIMPDSFIDIIITESNELIQELVFEACEYSNSESLNENVSYVDNNGQLHYTSTEYYTKHMHEYETKTPVEKYDPKKLKNRKYNLLDENLDSFKKLSEMSLEEILSEEI